MLTVLVFSSGMTDMFSVELLGCAGSISLVHVIASCTDELLGSAESAALGLIVTSGTDEVLGSAGSEACCT